MSYTTLADYGGTENGLQVLFLYLNSITNGLFIGVLLFILYIVILMGSYYAQKNATGVGNFPVAFALAGFFTLVSAGLLRIADEGIVGMNVFAVCMVAFILGLITLFMTKNYE